MLDSKQEVRISKLMTRMLRHTPEEFGLKLDPQDASCPVGELLEAMRALPRWSRVTREDVEQVVRNSDKQRFELREERIRARYGHSYTNVQYTPGVPPAVLFHGTNRQALPSILKQGISPMGRQYVHLSEGTGFAELAGRRRGELVLLQVDTEAAAAAGVTFYYAGNEVWLSDAVPPGCCAVWSLDVKARNKV